MVTIYRIKKKLLMLERSFSTVARKTRFKLRRTNKTLLGFIAILCNKDLQNTTVVMITIIIDQVKI